MKKKILTPQEEAKDYTTNIMIFLTTKLKEELNKDGVRESHVAKRFGFTHGQLTKMVNGQGWEKTRLDSVLKLAKGLNVSFREVFFAADPKLLKDQADIFDRMGINRLNLSNLSDDELKKIGQMITLVIPDHAVVQAQAKSKSR